MFCQENKTEICVFQQATEFFQGTLLSGVVTIDGRTSAFEASALRCMCLISTDVSGTITSTGHAKVETYKKELQLFFTTVLELPKDKYGKNS